MLLQYTNNRILKGGVMMKKALSVSVYLLFVLNLLFPAVTLLGSFCGYAVTFVQIPALAVVLLVLSVCTVALSSVSKEAAFGKVTGVLLALLAPLAIGNAVFLIFGMVKDNAWFVTVLPALCVLASAGCCCYLAARYGAPKGLKNTCLVLFAVMAIPSIFFGFLALTFGNIGVNTVVQTVASPEGGFYAEIIDNDQGALGGNTYVVVHEDHAINAVFFKIEKKPKYVYTGRWGEFQNMQLYWKSEDCLVINDIEYEVR